MYCVEGHASNGDGGDPKAGCGLGADATSIKELKYWPSAGGLKEIRSVDDVLGCKVYCSGKTFIHIAMITSSGSFNHSTTTLNTLQATAQGADF